jgi:transposase InsO family protein
MPLTILGRRLVQQVFVVTDLTSEVILGSDFIHRHALSYDALSQSLFYDPLLAWDEGFVLSAEAVTLGPREIHRVKVKVQSSPGENVTGPCLCVADITCTELPIFGETVMVDLDERGRTTVSLENMLDIPMTIPRHAFIGEVLKLEEKKCHQIHLDMNAAPLSSPPTGDHCDPEKAAFIAESLRPQLAHLSPEHQQAYMTAVLKNHDVFSKDKFDLGRTDILSHSVQMKDAEPVYVKQFRIPETHRSVLIEHLNNWLKLGVVSPSKSHYNSPIFCVPKKDGTFRPVLDFRAINEKSFVDKYSQREVQDCIDEIGRAKSTIFSSLDLTAGFWQLPLDPESRPFTCFTIPGIGSFEWNMTPMGLLGSPASFGRMMDFIMRFLSVITYQDDILVHSRSHDVHLAELQKVFDRLRAHGLKLNVKKCFFAQEEVAYLGFTLTPNGILPGKDKSSAIRDFRPCGTVRQVREFVGLCNYFRQSVPNFSRLARPLTALTTKDCTWKGGDLPAPALAAFYKLKDALINPPGLAYPHPDLPYHLMVDASIGSDEIPGGLGAALVQIGEDDVPRAIGYASSGLSKFQRNYSAYLLELQAAVFGITHFDVYLRGRQFTLHTDHRPLETLSKVHTRTLNRLQQLMLEYNFTIVYKPGVENTVADCLSRNPISSVVTPEVNWDHFKQLQAADPLIAKLMASLSSPASNDDATFRKLRSFLSMQNGILFHSKGGVARLFCPAAMQAEILQSAHNSLAGGHMGIFKTKNRILSRYFWPTLDVDIKQHLSCCIICQQTRPARRTTRAPLVPLPQPPAPNHRLHIDLFGPLHVSTQGKKFVMVMTDAFTKYVELAALPDKTAESVAEALMSCWFTRYTVPKEILSDNGREFCNNLMKEICKCLGILHKTTSPYHPECNASAEVFNRTMKNYLQAAIDSPYLEWEQYLPALRLCYNTSVSKATLATPFSLVFGMDPHMPIFDFEPSFSYDENRPDALVQLFYARKKALEHNIIYRQQYAVQHDAANKIVSKDLDIDDQIFVSCRPKQKYKNAKLHDLFEGPFPVVRLSPPNVYYKVGRKTHVAHLNRVKKARLAPFDLAEDQMIVQNPGVLTPNPAAPNPLVLDVDLDSLPGGPSVRPKTGPSAFHRAPAQYASDSGSEADVFEDVLEHAADMSADADADIPDDAANSEIDDASMLALLPVVSLPSSAQPKATSTHREPKCLADLALSGPARSTRSKGSVRNIPLPKFPLGGKVFKKHADKEKDKKDKKDKK